jgi:hypothetical protein
MNIQVRTLFLVLSLTACLFAACSPPEPGNNPTDQSSAPVPAAPPESAIPPTSALNEQISTGTLQNVDLTAKTFVLRDAIGSEQTFWFSDSTEITGTAGTQGLSGRQGNQATVRHIDQDGRRMAVHIDIRSN